MRLISCLLPAITLYSLTSLPAVNPANAQSSQSSTQPSSYKIKGNLTLISSRIEGSADNCYGTGGYDDITANMPVTIWDGSGKIIATSNTGVGNRQPGEYSSVVCIFPFEVNNIPKADFYTIEIGHRGKLNYSFSELQQKNWNVEFSLSRG